MKLTTIFNTDAFKKILDDAEGIASSNRFRVTLPPIDRSLKADGTTLTDRTNLRDLALLCTAARIPGKNISVVDRNIGLEQVKVGNAFNYGDVILTFYLTNDYSARKYFQNWLDCIVSPTPPFNAGFHSNYAKSVTVQQLDKLGKVKYEVEMIKAFPTTMTEVELNNQAQSGALELSVSLTFSHFIVKEDLNGA